MTDKSFSRSMLLAALAVSGCLLDPRRAGTSTTTENTVTGVARLADGKPAAGASVSARSPIVKIPADRIPIAQELATAVAGPDGAFRIKVPGNLAFFLEIESEAGDSIVGPVEDTTAGPRLGGAVHTELYLGEFAEPLRRDTALGEVGLAYAASVFGRLEADTALAGKSAWIGIPGTGRFTRVDFPAAGDSSVAFSLNAVPPGAHPLVLIVPSETGVAGAANLVAGDTLVVADTEPGTPKDVGILARPMPD